MHLSRTAPDAFVVEFESVDELRAEHQANLSVGGLLLKTSEPPALHSALQLTLRGPGGDEMTVPATVVAPMLDGVAIAFEPKGDELLQQLLPKNAEESAADEMPGQDRRQPLNERLREMTRTQKIIFATKADRTERALLLQDNDPQVLSSLLKNPRITIDEVVRVAKSSFLGYQTAELIVKTGQFMASVDVRIALIHNPKTPPAFALRILPTLPESEIRNIARGAATSMAIKQAALKRLQGGK